MNVIFLFLLLGFQGGAESRPATHNLDGLRNTIDENFKKNFCNLDYQDDPRYFSSPVGNAFLAGLRHFESESKKEYEKMLTKDYCEQVSTKPESLSAETLLAISSYISELKSDRESPINYNCIRSLSSIDKELIKKFKGKKWFYTFSDSTREYVDWKKIFLDKEASKNLLDYTAFTTIPRTDDFKKLDFYIKSKPTFGKIANFLKQYPNLTAQQLGALITLPGIDLGSGSYFENQVAKNYILNLLEDHSATNTPLKPVIRETLVGKDRLAALIEEREFWCKYLGNPKISPEEIQKKFQELEEKKIQKPTALNEVEKQMLAILAIQNAKRALALSSNPQGVPVEFRKYLWEKAQSDQGRVKKFNDILSKLARYGVDPKIVTQFVLNPDTNRLLDKNGLEVLKTLIEEGNLPLAFRKNTRDAEFLNHQNKIIDSYLEVVNAPPPGSKDPSPLLPPIDLVSKTPPFISKDPKANTLTKYRKQLVNYYLGTEADSETKGILNTKENDGEASLHQGSPQTLINLYQFIATEQGWKVTPKQISEDLLNHFPNTQLEEIKKFRADVLKYGDRFSEMMTLEKVIKDRTKGKADSAKIETIKQGLSKIQDLQDFQTKVTTIIDSLHENPEIFEAITVSPLGNVSVDPKKLAHFALLDGSHGNQEVKDNTFFKRIFQNWNTVDTENKKIKQYALGLTDINFENKVTAKQLYDFLGREFGRDFQFPISDLFCKQCDLSKKPSVVELKFFRNYLEDLFAKNTEPLEKTVLLDKFIHSLYNKEFKLFRTPKEMEKIFALRKSLSSLPKEKIEQYAEVLKLSLLNSPQLLEAIYINSKGELDIKPNQMKAFGYLVPAFDRDGNDKEAEAKNQAVLDLNQKIIQYFQTQLKSPELDRDKVLKYFSDHYLTETGNSLESILEKDPDIKSIRSALNLMLVVDSLSFKNKNYQVPTEEYLLAKHKNLRTAQAKQATAPLLLGVSPFPIAMSLPKEAYEDLGVRIANKINHADKTLAALTQINLFDLAEQNDSQLLNQVEDIFQHLGTEEKQLREEIESHQKHSSGLAPKERKEELEALKKALASVRESRERAAQLVYGNLLGETPHLFLPGSANVTFDVGKGKKITLESVPTRWLNQFDDDKYNLLWELTPTSLYDCDTDPKINPKDKPSQMSPAKTVCQGIKFYETPSGKWEKDLEDLLVNDFESFKKIVHHLRYLEADIVRNKNAKEPFIKKMKEVLNKYFALNKKSVEIKMNISPNADRNFDLGFYELGNLGKYQNKNLGPLINQRHLPYDFLKRLEDGRIGSKDLTDRLLKLKPKLFGELLLQPWLRDYEKQAPDKVSDPKNLENLIARLEKEVEKFDSRVNRVQDWFTKNQSLKIEGNSEGAKKLNDQLEALVKSKDPKDRIFIGDIVSYLKYYPANNSFKKAVYEAILPNHLQKFISGTEYESKPIPAKLKGYQFKGENYHDLMMELVPLIPANLLAQEHGATAADKAKSDELLLERILSKTLAHHTEILRTSRKPELALEAPKGLELERSANPFLAPQTASALIRSLSDTHLKPIFTQNSDIAESLSKIRLDLSSFERHFVSTQKESDLERKNKLNAIYQEIKLFYLNNLCFVQLHAQKLSEGKPSTLKISDRLALKIDPHLNLQKTEQLEIGLKAILEVVEEKTKGSISSMSMNREFSNYCHLVNTHYGLEGDSTKGPASFELSQIQKISDLDKLYLNQIKLLKELEDFLVNGKENFILRKDDPIGSLTAFKSAIAAYRGKDNYYVHPLLRKLISETEVGTRIDTKKLQSLIQRLEAREKMIKASPDIQKLTAVFNQTGDPDLNLFDIDFLEQVTYNPHSDLQKLFVERFYKPAEMGLPENTKIEGPAFSAQTLDELSALSPLAQSATRLLIDDFGHANKSKVERTQEEFLDKHPGMSYSKMLNSDEYMAAIKPTHEANEKRTRELVEILTVPDERKLIRFITKEPDLRKLYSTQWKGALDHRLREYMTLFKNKAVSKEIALMHQIEGQYSPEQRAEHFMLVWWNSCEGQSTNPKISYNAKFFGSPQPPPFGGLGNKLKIENRACSKVKAQAGVTRNPEALKFDEAFNAIPSLNYEQKKQLRQWAVSQLILFYKAAGKTEELKNIDKILANGEKGQSDFNLKAILLGLNNGNKPPTIVDKALATMIWAIDYSETREETAKDKVPSKLAQRDSKLQDPLYLASREMANAEASQGKAAQTQFIEKIARERHQAGAGGVDGETVAGILKLPEASIRKLDLLKSKIEPKLYGLLVDHPNAEMIDQTYRKRVGEDDRLVAPISIYPYQIKKDILALLEKNHGNIRHPKVQVELSKLLQLDTESDDDAIQMALAKIQGITDPKLVQDVIAQVKKQSEAAQEFKQRKIEQEILELYAIEKTKKAILAPKPTYDNKNPPLQPIKRWLDYLSNENTLKSDSELMAEKTRHLILLRGNPKITPKDYEKIFESVGEVNSELSDQLTQDYKLNNEERAAIQSLVSASKILNFRKQHGDELPQINELLKIAAFSEDGSDDGKVKLRAKSYLVAANHEWTKEDNASHFKRPPTLTEEAPDTCKDKFTKFAKSTPVNEWAESVSSRAVTQTDQNRDLLWQMYDSFNRKQEEFLRSNQFVSDDWKKFQKEYLREKYRRQSEIFRADHEIKLILGHRKMLTDKLRALEDVKNNPKLAEKHAENTPDYQKRFNQELEDVRQRLASTKSSYATAVAHYKDLLKTLNQEEEVWEKNLEVEKSRERDRREETAKSSLENFVFSLNLSPLDLDLINKLKASDTGPQAKFELRKQLKQQIQEKIKKIIACSGTAADADQLLRLLAINYLDSSAVDGSGKREGFSKEKLKDSFLRQFAEREMPKEASRDTGTDVAVRDNIMHRLEDYLNLRSEMKAYLRELSKFAPDGMVDRFAIDPKLSLNAQANDLLERSSTNGSLLTYDGAHWSQGKAGEIIKNSPFSVGGAKTQKDLLSATAFYTALNEEWIKIALQKKSTEGLREKLAKVGIKPEGDDLSFDNVDLFRLGKSEESVKDTLTQAHVLVPPKEDKSPLAKYGLEEKKTPWDDLKEKLIEAHFSSGMQPWLEYGNTAVRVTFDPSISDFKFEFHELSKIREEATKRVFNITQAFDQAQNGLLDLRHQNNRHTTLFGFTDDEKQSSLVNRNLDFIGSQLPSLHEYGGILVDPEGKVVEKTVKKPDGTLTYYVEPLAEAVVAEKAEMQRKHLPEKAAKLKTKVGDTPFVASVSTDELALQFGFQKQHKTLMDVKETLENIREDKQQMVQQLVIDGAIIAATWYIPGVTPAALAARGWAAASKIAGGFRSAAMLDLVSKLGQEGQSLAYTDAGWRGTLFGDPSQIGQSGAKDSETDFYKNFLFFAGHAGLLDKTQKFLKGSQWVRATKGKVGDVIKRKWTLESAGKGLDVLSPGGQVARGKWLNILGQDWLVNRGRHYGGNIALNVATMHTTSTILDSIATLYFNPQTRNKALSNPKELEEMLGEVFFKALSTDAFALGMDQHLAGAFKSKGSKFAAALSGQLGMHSVTTYFEYFHEGHKLEDAIQLKKKEIAETQNQDRKELLREELAEIETENEKNTFKLKWQANAIQHMVTYLYFANNARKHETASNIRARTEVLNLDRFGGPKSYEEILRNHYGNKEQKERLAKLERQLNIPDAERPDPAKESDASRRDALKERNKILAQMEGEMNKNDLSHLSYHDIQVLREKAQNGNQSQIVLEKIAEGVGLTPSTLTRALEKIGTYGKGSINPNTPFAEAQNQIMRNVREFAKAEIERMRKDPQKKYKAEDYIDLIKDLKAAELLISKSFEKTKVNVRKELGGEYWYEALPSKVLLNPKIFAEVSPLIAADHQLHTDLDAGRFQLFLGKTAQLNQAKQQTPPPMKTLSEVFSKMESQGDAGKLNALRDGHIDLEFIKAVYGPTVYERISKVFLKAKSNESPQAAAEFLKDPHLDYDTILRGFNNGSMKPTEIRNVLMEADLETVAQLSHKETNKNNALFKSLFSDLEVPDSVLRQSILDYYQRNQPQKNTPFKNVVVEIRKGLQTKLQDAMESYLQKRPKDNGKSKLGSELKVGPENSESEVVTLIKDAQDLYKNFKPTQAGLPVIYKMPLYTVWPWKNLQTRAGDISLDALRKTGKVEFHTEILNEISKVEGFKDSKDFAIYASKIFESNPHTTLGEVVEQYKTNLELKQDVLNPYQPKLNIRDKKAYDRLRDESGVAPKDLAKVEERVADKVFTSATKNMLQDKLRVYPNANGGFSLAPKNVSGPSTMTPETVRETTRDYKVYLEHLREKSGFTADKFNGDEEAARRTFYRMFYLHQSGYKIVGEGNRMERRKDPQLQFEREISLQQSPDKFAIDLQKLYASEEKMRAATSVPREKYFSYLFDYYGDPVAQAKDFLTYTRQRYSAEPKP